MRALPTLSAIALHLLSENDAEQLRGVSVLRRLENLLQSINDEQTRRSFDELNRARLAWAMDFADWPQLLGC
ncbi:MAG: hypothetical protein ACLRP3_16965 [Escherichia sp.]